MQGENGLAICPLCNKPITVQQRHSQYQRVEGWEKIAGVRLSGKHGGSDISLRQRRDQFAHGHCVDFTRAGIDPGQTTLV